MNRLLYIFFGLVILLSFGCSQKACPPANTIRIHDTVTVTRQVRFRDTSITVPGAKTSVMFDWNKFMAHEDAKDTTTVGSNSSQQAHLKVLQVGKSVIVNCDCDSVVKQVRLQDSLININQQHSETKIVVVEKKYVPLIVNRLAWFGGICLILLLAYVIKKFWLK